jgi:hypothetical protein
MNLSTVRLVITTVLILAGCQLQAQHQPALLNKPSQPEINKISHVIGEALGTNNIRLSHTIFSETNVLIVERQPIKSNPHLHSANDMPDHFVLLKDSNGCFIYHKQSEQQWLLENIECYAYQDKGDI